MFHHSTSIAATLAFALSLSTPGLIASAMQPSTPPSEPLVGLAAGKAHRASAVELAALDWSRRISRASTVIIATSRTPADALTSGVLHGAYDAPLFYADHTYGLAQETLAEIARLGATRAVILGGPNAVPAVVERQLVGTTITRLAGETRIETALAVAKEATTAQGTRAKAPKGVLLVRSVNPSAATDPTAEFGDAIGAGALAAAEDYVVLLTPTDHLPGSVHAALSQWPGVPVIAVGGPQAISDQTLAQVPAHHPKRRVAGPTRVETSIELARLHHDQPKGVTVLDGYSLHAWAHGLAAALFVDERDHALVSVQPQYAAAQATQAVGRLGLPSTVPVEAGPGVTLPPPGHRPPAQPTTQPTTTPAPRPSQPPAPQPPTPPRPTETRPPATKPTATPTTRPTSQPTGQPTTPPTTKPRDGVVRDTAAEAAITTYVNRERVNRGLKPVQRHGGLDENARAWTQVMLEAGKIWHADDWAAQINATIAQYPNDNLGRANSENVIISPNYGKNTGPQLFESWHESPGHANNMYRASVTHMGLAVLCTPSTCYATQRFTSGR